jgi:glycosyltransferase involved in cell wall biosynthesis
LAAIFAKLPMDEQHILIICHTFPPAPGVGGRRWAKFAKEFARRGHTVHVICAQAPRSGVISAWARDVEHNKIIRYPLRRLYPGVVTRLPLTRLWDKLEYRFWLRTLPLLSIGNPLDTAIFWRSQLLGLATRIIQEHSIGHVIVSGAPFRLLVHALTLKEKFPDLRLVGDLRDPWTWGHLYGLPNLAAARMASEKAMERKVVNGMDLLITPGEGILDHLRNTYPEHKKAMLHVPHALDPDDMPPTVGLRNSPPRKLIYAGTWYGNSEADAYVAALIKALQSSTVRDVVTLDLYITANDTRKAEATVAAAGLSNHIRFHGALSNSLIMQRIAAADAALVFTPNDIKDAISTKFNELFHLRIPVIHVGSRGRVQAHLETHALGLSIPLDDLPVTLPKILSGEQPLQINGHYDTSPVTLPQITDMLLREVWGLNKGD